jgi:hypothetical protein
MYSFRDEGRAVHDQLRSCILENTASVDVKKEEREARGCFYTVCPCLLRTYAGLLNHFRKNGGEARATKGRCFSHMFSTQCFPTNAYLNRY